ncbi:MAG: SCO family protein [Gammaproteobacteria bacterium]
MQTPIPGQRGPSSAARWLVGLIGLAALIGGALFAKALLLQPLPPPPALGQGVTRLDAPRALTDFRLVDHTGAVFDQGRLRGHWTFLFFGYSLCPDICPTTMSTLNAVAQALADRAERRPQYVFVTIDPERDTPEQLAKFVPYFNPTFLGVTGEPDAIKALTRQLGILYLKAEPERSEGYLMDHSASILLIDPEGRFHAVMSPPFDPTGMARNFQLMADYYEATR